MAHNLSFVYVEQFRGAGSTVMRGFQLADIARRHLGRRVRVDVRPLAPDFKHSTLFLTKGALKVATAETLARLKSRGNRLLFDVVDELPPETTREFADVVVASSLTAFEGYGRQFPGIRVALVNHHVDPRLEAAVAGPRPSTFRIGYFGERENAVLSPRIEEAVEVVHIDTSTEDTRWLSSIPHFSMHYAVRRTRLLDQFKPFLKGFTAAHAGAPILIQRSQEEAVRWLGDDYPFLMDAPLTEETILAAIAEAQAEFGGTRWREALEVMAGLRERTSPDRIAGELATLL